MATRLTPVDPHTLAADRATLKALQGLSDYQPTNSAYSVEAALLLEQALTQAELADYRAEEARLQTRSVRNETGDAFHSVILGIKAQVIAQYGDDSYAVKAIGLTRRSERKRPTRRKVAGA
ncbi:hypothetical protein K2Z83_17625 [Oscillochloris sp. ZM17-4]|uniref:hypothetical protein n=1 Tax=Oscillochloris sp. ZM17-4 TaxID=2866714 RepID=UPI001C738BC0|nr:hypothetical protein [Oscillochloris sp. ZM17-4]MBX0329493.1 hypothetical protein [Oscillochloris sp. ZM17-4]